jgi:esterase/lipase
MRDISVYLSELLTNLEQQLTSYLNKISDLEFTTNKLLAMLDNPDELDKIMLDNYLDDSIKSSFDYKLMLGLKGCYKEYAEESQVINSKNYLSDLIRQITNKIQSELEELNVSCNNIRTSIEKLEEVINFLNLYNKDVFVDDNMLLLIHEITSNMTITDDVIDFYFTIAKNNAAILKQKQVVSIKTPVITDAVLDSMEEESKLDDSNQILLNKRKEILDIYGQFVASYDNTLYPELTESLEEIFGNLSEVVAKSNIMELESSMEIMDLGYEFIESLDTPNEIKIATALSIIKNYNDKEVITKIIKLYENNYKYSFKLDEETQNMLRDFESNNYTKINDLQSFISSFEDLDEDSIISILKSRFNGEISYEEYLLVAKYFELKQFITLYTLDGVTKKELEEFNELLNIFNDAIELSNEEEVEELRHNNYIIFLDKDAFLSQADELVNTHHNVGASEIEKKLKKVLCTEFEMLNMCSKPLMDGGEVNEYKLREMTGGNVRLIYKALSSKKIDGHNIILVLGVTYGIADYKQKNKYLTEQMAQYAASINSVSLLEGMFNQYSAFDELPTIAQKRINEGFEVYKHFEDLAREEKRS